MANSHSIDLEDGSSQSLSITDANQTGLDITGDISIEAWIKRESATDNDVICSKFLSAGDQRSWQFSITSAGVLGFIYSSDGGFTASSNITWHITDSAQITSLDTWYHVAITVDVSAKTLVFYVNGSSVASSNNGAQWNFATSINNSTAEVSIGADEAHASNFFDGLIDEVRIWDDIRTAQEISDNYETELVGNEANLQAYWKLNNSLLDETSNDNDLTNNNSAVFSTDIPSWGVEFTVTDTFSITDTETAIRVRSFTLSENLTLSENISVLRGFIFAVSDSIGLTDTITTLRGLVVSAVDSIGLTDTLGRFTTPKFSVSDSFSLSDLLGRFTTPKFSVSSQINLSDTTIVKALWNNIVKHTSNWIEKAQNSTSWIPKNKS
jgi:hypothetical protein